MGKGLKLPKKNRITDFSRVKEIINFEQNDKADLPYNIFPFDIPMEFIGCNAIVKNASEKCFLSPFSEEDITYFVKELQNPVYKTQLNYAQKQVQIERSLQNWKSSKTKYNCNPIEPFLYALKLSDGIIGSAGNNGSPVPEQLDVFAQALLPYWDKNYEEDTRIICHILVNWDWYQPLLVVIRMYQLQENYNYSDIDEILRNQKLFTPDYAAVTFECLVHHPTLENMNALLKFVSRSYQDAVVTGAEIQVTKNEKKLFENMYNLSPFDIQTDIKKIYISKYDAYADVKSRRWLNDIFDIEDWGSAVYKRYIQYTIANGKEKQEHYDYLVKHWDLSDGSQQGICRKISDDMLFDLAVRKLRNLSGYSYAGILWNFANNKYPKARKLIKDEMESVSINEEKWVGCACASNMAYGSPDMYEIARQFFVFGNGYQYKLQIQWLTKTPAKAKELRDSVCKILNSIKDKQNVWGKFLNACQQLYFDEYGMTNYPVEIDKLLNKAISKAAVVDSRIVYDVLGVVENVMNRSNRDRYLNMLVDIYYTKSFSEAARSRARKLIDIYFSR